MPHHLKNITFTLTVTLALLFPLSAGAAPLIKELADDVFTVKVGDFPYTSLVVVGNDGVLITDPAFTPRAQGLKNAIATITDKPVTRIVLSHEHYDHVGGTEVFPEADIICHRSCRSVFALDVLGRAPKEVDVVFDDFLSFDFGGKKVHLHHYGPADGAGSSVLFLPDERIAFTADLYETRGLTPGRWMDDDNSLAIMRVLKELNKKNLAHAVNAHSDSTSVRDIEENLAFMEDLFTLVFGEIQKALQAGGPVAVMRNMERWQNELKLPQYADWHGYDEHLPSHIRRMTLSIFHGG